LLIHMLLNKASSTVPLFLTLVGTWAHVFSYYQSIYWWFSQNDTECNRYSLEIYDDNR
jgi:hypothetical protein